MSSVTIKARPADATIEPATTALIVIDVQKDFVCHGGYGEFLGNDVELLRSVIDPISKVLDKCRQLKMTIVHTREGHKSDMSDCPDTKLSRWPSGTRIGDKGPMGRILIIGEEGQDIVDELKPVAGEHLIDKPGKNSFYNTDLDSFLKRNKIKHLLVTGVTTDVCCFTTVTAANDHGYHAIVLEDCVASYSPERHQAALEIITAQGGIFGWVSNSSNVLDALDNVNAVHAV